jgi:hypothetical protein
VSDRRRRAFDRAPAATAERSARSPGFTAVIAVVFAAAIDAVISSVINSVIDAAMECVARVVARCIAYMSHVTVFGKTP